MGKKNTKQKHFKAHQVTSPLSSGHAEQSRSTPLQEDARNSSHHKETRISKKKKTKKKKKKHIAMKTLILFSDISTGHINNRTDEKCKLSAN